MKVKFTLICLCLQVYYYKEDDDMSGGIRKKQGRVLVLAKRTKQKFSKIKQNSNTIYSRVCACLLHTTCSHHSREIFPFPLLQSTRSRNLLPFFRGA